MSNRTDDEAWLDDAARVAIDGAADTPFPITNRELERVRDFWPFTANKTNRMVKRGEMVAVWIGGQPFVSRRLLREFLEEATRKAGEKVRSATGKAAR